MEALLALTLALMTPCEYEDSTDCIWLAADRGNSFGSSFVDVNGTAFYFGDIK